MPDDSSHPDKGRDEGGGLCLLVITPARASKLNAALYFV